MRPALTPEARENQMIALAVDLAEKQLRGGNGFFAGNYTLSEAGFYQRKTGKRNFRTKERVTDRTGGRDTGCKTQ